LEWAEEPKRLHAENRKRLIEQLAYELGPMNLEGKLQNFRDAGSTPFSIIAYHNSLFCQSSMPSFIVGSCALGEAIFNHLILDLRAFF
jgi:hypothetical protein